MLFTKKNLLMKLPYFAVSIVLFIVDLVSKILVNKYMPLPRLDSAAPYNVDVLPPFFYFTHIKNKGIAFGMLNDIPEEYHAIKIVVLSIIAFVLIGAIIYMILSASTKHKVTLIAFTLILGGAFGNVFDRIIVQEVTDFIYMGLTNNIRFPWIFNAADTWITIGVVLALLAYFVFKEDIDGDKVKDMGDSSSESQ